MVRVHDVAATAQLLAVWAAIDGAADDDGGPA
jgi:dihydropteroate synthase